MATGHPQQSSVIGMPPPATVNYCCFTSVHRCSFHCPVPTYVSPVHFLSLLGSATQPPTNLQPLATTFSASFLPDVAAGNHCSPFFLA
ncbi:hypothetical protein Nepgr_027143 [Nepenthes gracilis]|uniref:Uncharacterized protein n=1 Tax=Nepenthes gracilis TaxID=150966 RepID=A0AAD3T9D3_NEPGR|nr:hypothetical protein Nepgr_027143 [Nepenthes gracilis]